ncbi:MAG: hypothetical protein IKC89_04475 [Lentisphaeria bacterium]|nr:hypothetical protein [Lentisphaeria bacterium]
MGQLWKKLKKRNILNNAVENIVKIKYSNVCPESKVGKSFLQGGKNDKVNKYGGNVERGSDMRHGGSTELVVSEL